jgi:hypothetical protein
MRGCEEDDLRAAHMHKCDLTQVVPGYEAALLLLFSKDRLMLNFRALLYFQNKHMLLFTIICRRLERFPTNIIMAHEP